MKPTLFGDPTELRTMGSHHNAYTGSNEWLTPPHVIEALGPFDLDPCSPIHRPWPTAASHYTLEDNGLTKPWHGHVWLNPPYTHIGAWLAKMIAHNDGIALTFARTETGIFFERIWPYATALLFLRGRLYFHRVNGQRAEANAGAPSVLIAYGKEAARRLTACDLPGQLVKPVR